MTWFDQAADLVLFRQEVEIAIKASLQYQKARL